MHKLVGKFNLIKKFNEEKNRKENVNLTEELNNVIEARKTQNVGATLSVLANYLVQEQLKETGLLYRASDNYIQTKVQQLFWEWKNEGLINEFEDFEDTTKSWIVAYA